MFSPLFFLILLNAPILAFAHLNPPKVIALIPPGNNLENENLIENLCPKTSSNMKKCREEKLQPKTWELNVYENAKEDSEALGKILIIGIPGRGLKAQFAPVKGVPKDFPSDSSNTDWGYSSFFEFTVSKTEGYWIQLPKRPFPSPVWINIKNDWSKKTEDELLPTPSVLDSETVYSVPNLGDIVITSFKDKNFSYREENSNDMLCGEEPQKIPPEKLKETTRPIDVLYDKDGHLLAWPKYSRGC